MQTEKRLKVVLTLEVPAVLFKCLFPALFPTSQRQVIPRPHGQCALIRRWCILCVSVLLALRPQAAYGIPEEAAFALSTDNQLFKFSTSTPGFIEQRIPIVGLPEGETLITIDFRPCLCGLYGISNRGGLYHIDTSTGEAVTRGSVPAFPKPDPSQSIEMDFDPHADAIRIISTTGDSSAVGQLSSAPQLSITAAPGLRYDPDSPSPTDQAQIAAGLQPRIVAIAYENNREGAGHATLWGIDATSNSLVTIGTTEPTTERPDTSWVWNANTSRVRTVASLRRFGDLAPVSGSQIVGFDVGFPDFSQPLIVVKLPDGFHLCTVEISGDQAGIITDVGPILADAPLQDVAISLGGDIVFSEPRISVAENAGSVSVMLERIGGLVGSPSVEVKTVPLTALPDSDYKQFFDEVVFPQGVRSQTISIPIVDNQTFSASREFRLVMTTPRGGATLGVKRYATVSIQEDEPPPPSFRASVRWPRKFRRAKLIAAGKNEGLHLKIQCSEDCEATGIVRLSQSSATHLGLPKKLKGTVATGSSTPLSDHSCDLTVKATPEGRRVLIGRTKKIRVSIQLTIRAKNGVSTLIAQKSGYLQ